MIARYRDWIRENSKKANLHKTATFKVDLILLNFKRENSKLIPKHFIVSF